MKILIPHREIGYFYGGAESHIREVAKRLAKRGNEIIILTEKGDEDTLNEIKKLKNIKIVYLPSTKIRHSNRFKEASENISVKISKFRLLTKYLRILNNLGWIIKSMLWASFHRKEFDVVWSSRNMDTSYIKFLNKFIKIPYIISLEGYDFIEAENAKNVNHVFTISQFICKTCQNKHGFIPSLIPIGIDIKEFQKADKTMIKN